MSTLAQDLEPPVPPEEIAAAEAETPKTDAETPKVEAPVVKEEPKKEEDPSPEKLVRLEALHEERGKRKKLQAELSETQRKQALLEGRLQQILEAQQPKEAAPDPAQDPWGHVVHGQQKTAQELEAVKQRLAQEDQQREHHNRKMQLTNWYVGQAAEYEKEAPDFREAYQHMQQLRVAQIKAIVGNNPQAIADALEQDELAVAYNAWQTQQNPAEIIYRMAQNTGWKKVDKTVVAPEKKMEALQKGLDASKTLGNGGQDSGWPTPEQIAKMSDDDFDALKAKLQKSGKRISDIV